jgi:plastocyanin
MNTRRVLVLAVVLLALSPTARAATEGVSEVGTSFQPAQIDVAVNDQVVWTNRSTQNHTVTFDNGPDLNPNCDPKALLFQPGCQAPGATVSRTFSAPGTYAYHCRFHQAQGMTGVIVVTAAATSSTHSASSSTTTTTARSSTTSTTRSTGSTTSTTRVLATSSTLVKSTTTTGDSSSAVQPGAPPSLGGDDGGSKAAGKAKGSGGGSDTGTVALIVGLLLVVSGGGGFLLWRLRPGRS